MTLAFALYNFHRPLLYSLITPLMNSLPFREIIKNFLAFFTTTLEQQFYITDEISLQNCLTWFLDDEAHIEFVPLLVSRGPANARR